jgi:rhodanese-related sulfurtransferase
MDLTVAPIEPFDLYVQLGTEASPLVIDVRRAAAFSGSHEMISGAIRRDPDAFESWSGSLSVARPVVAYCVHGHEVSQRVVAGLHARGFNASYLAGGIEGWREQKLPIRKRNDDAPPRWITREHPKIDRIACPWLIRRFIDPEASFFYVPTNQVLAKAAEIDAIPYDVDGVKFTHEGERCSFDTLLRIYGIEDPALDHLATIVRGADTSRHDLAAPCAGLFAISLGLSRNFSDDHEMLRHGMVIYDALYTWCRDLQQERHNWPAQRKSKVRT